MTIHESERKVRELPISDSVIRAIIFAGIQAPSGDNIQPWIFEIKENQIRIHIQEELDMSYFNFRQIPSLLSLGAVIENCIIAASSYGLSTFISYENKESNNIAAILTFQLSDEPCDHLFDAIWTRRTNRRQYSSVKVSNEQLKKLREAIVHFPNVTWHEVSEKMRIKKLARAVYLVDIIRSERKDLHVHLQKLLRFSQKSAYRKKDGLPVETLQAGWFGEFFLKYTHPWKIMKIFNYFGFSYIVARFVYNEIISSSTLVLVTIPKILPAYSIEAGRALERVWLEATHTGIALQPQAGLPIFLLRKKLLEMGALSERHKKFLIEAEQLEKECFNDFDNVTENQVMLFRLGHAKPVEVRTLRRSIDTFIK